MGRTAHVLVEIRLGTIAHLARAVRCMQARDADFPNLLTNIRTVEWRKNGDTRRYIVAEGWWYKFPGKEAAGDAVGARGLLARALARQGLEGRLSVVPWDEGKPADVWTLWDWQRVPRARYTSFQPKEA